MPTDAANPRTPLPSENDGVAVDGAGLDAPAKGAPAATGSVPTGPGTRDARTDATRSPGADETVPGPTVPAPRSAVGPVPVADEDTGGRLTTRMSEARARLEPERAAIPAPRTPDGVVPPALFGRGAGAAPDDLVQAVDDLLARLAELEQDDAEQDETGQDETGQDETGQDEGAPERRALVRALELSAAGVPDAGWSAEEDVAPDALAGAAELAGALCGSAEKLLERLDAEERSAPAVEVDAVVTALRVARVVLDLEAFDRHGR